MNGGAPEGVGQLRLGVVLTLAMGVGPLVIFSLSSLAPELVVDLGVHRVQLGLLATVAYLAAAPLCLMAGPLLRWLDASTVLLLLFGLAAIALALISGARSWWWLCSAAFLSGVVQSMSNPVTNLLVSTSSDRRRGALMGVKQAGVQMGQLCAGIVALAALLVSWRAAGIFGLATATGNPVVLWTGVVVHAAGAIAANVVIIHALITIVRPEQVAAASGFQALAQYLGFAVGPLSFGLLVDQAGSYAVGWVLVATGYLTALAIARFAPIDR